MSQMIRSRRLALLGFAYGCLLFVFAFGSSGMGHGTFLPFAIYGAPISIIPIVGMFIAPVWWGAIWWMLSLRRRRTVAILLTIHTIAVGFFLWFGTPMEHGEDQWTYVSKAERFLPLWFWGGMVVYIVGLWFTWAATIRGGVDSE